MPPEGKQNSAKRIPNSNSISGFQEDETQRLHVCRLSLPWSLCPDAEMLRWPLYRFYLRVFDFAECFNKGVHSNLLCHAIRITYTTRQSTAPWYSPGSDHVKVDSESYRSKMICPIQPCMLVWMTCHGALITSRALNAHEHNYITCFTSVGCNVSTHRLQ